MELNNVHREALLVKLEERIYELDIAKQVVDKMKGQDSEFAEIRVWLLEIELKAIRKALTENEIDY